MTAVQYYLKDADKHLYTDDQVNDLVTKYHAGCQDSLNNLVHYSVRLVFSIASDIARRFRSQVMEFVSVANIQLLRAIDKFDPTRCKFSTYVYKWIRGACIRYGRQSLKHVNYENLENIVETIEPPKPAFLDDIRHIKDFDILRLYFGIDCDPHTTTQIGKIYNRSQQSMSDRKDKALRQARLILTEN